MIVKYYNQMVGSARPGLPRSPVRCARTGGRLSGRAEPITTAHCRTARGCGVLAPIRQRRDRRDRRRAVGQRRSILRRADHCWRTPLPGGFPMARGVQALVRLLLCRGECVGDADELVPGTRPGESALAFGGVDRAPVLPGQWLDTAFGQQVR